ncbi:MAG TPA: 23S rRNA (adenine(2030)-N(6))-methyltransferase RlmJ [Myxococcales bacterium]|jgi:23S rRNA (adenine2030-N6)-methyltransferase|nr:23S rRNA (adenine(2030)-N(6))-methyltransferase RlmJ [Myxococcales bacterium]
MDDLGARAAPPSRAASDYAHARHAGNSGDVFKHVALAALLRALPDAALYVETHAGDGIFTLGSVGEWTTGVQKLWDAADGAAEGAAHGAVDRWLSAVRGFSRPGAVRPERYPGSPLLARALLPPRARLILHEVQGMSAHVLRRVLGDAALAEVVEQDGFAALPGALAQAGGGPAVALVDPPYAQKSEWDQAAHALSAARAAAPAAALLLWYPIKALTRPRALLAQLARLGVHGTAVELITTPLRLKRDRLSGSGVVLAGAPRSAAEELCAALPRLGPPLATHGEWSSVAIGF